jgi:acyl-coenzyme A thioesterase PaaI-like protein
MTTALINMDSSTLRPMTTRGPSEPEKPGDFHCHCFACGPLNPGGLGLQFTTAGARTTGTIAIDKRFQGYDDMAQGGIVATILDSAMVRLLHDLFGGSPLTGRLDTRYFVATPLHTQLTVNARIIDRHANTFRAEAELLQGTRRCASARGVFKILHA